MTDRHPEDRLFESFDRLGPTERGEVVRHVSRCSDCRLRLLHEEPARVFAVLGQAAIPAAALDRLTASIDAEIDRGESAMAPARRRFAWGSVAASLLLGGLIGAYLLSQPEFSGVTPRPTVGTATIELVEDVEPRHVGSGIEILAPTDAQVYDLSVGETQIVMIFDKRLDI